MYEVISQLRAGKYVLLELDKAVEERAYDGVLCDGDLYNVVPKHSLDGIAIESNKSFIGKHIRLVASGGKQSK